MYKSNSNSKSKPFLLHSLSERERYIQLITIMEGEVDTYVLGIRFNPLDPNFSLTFSRKTEYIFLSYVSIEELFRK